MENYRRLFLLMKVMVLSLLIFPVRSFAATPDKEVAKSLVDKSLINITEPSQQQKRVTGVVTEKDGSPMAGVTVVVTGTTIGTITGQNGEYSIDIPGGANSLTFSFIGMETQVINIGALALINVIMKESAVGLDEVVVIGYGTSKKKDLTGSVSSIEAQQLNQRPIISTSATLQGMASGVTVTTQTGSPGGDGGQIRIRGINSFGGSDCSPFNFG